MKTNLKLALGGVAGVLCAGGLAAGLIACSSGDPAPRASAPEPAPIDTPDLEPELATTHRPTIEAPRVEAPAVEETESFEPELRDGDVRVRRLIVATGIDRHEPTGASDELEIGAQPRIYAFVDAVNETGEPARLEVTFEPEHGESAGHVTLEVPARVARYRTWAYTRHVYTEGRWHAVVRDENGRLIARRPFDVVE